MPVTISGTLYTNNDELAVERSFDVSNGNQTFQLKEKTDKNGRFTLKLPVEANGDKVSLLFALANSEQPKVNNSSKKITAAKKEFSIEESSVLIHLDSKKKDLGNVEMTIAYDKENPPFGYLLKIGKAALEPKLKEVGSKLLRRDLKEIQERFKIKNIELSTRNIWNFFRRGICPAYFKKEGENVSTEFHWRAHKFDRADSLTDFCKAHFTKQGELVKIETQFRKGMEIAKSAEDLYPARTFVPTDKDFNVGKRILMNNGILYGQLFHHLILRHFYGTIMAKLITNYLAPTALGPLLMPHTPLTQTITEVVGKKAISGQGGILDASALPPQAIIESVPRGLAGKDPFGRPRGKMDNDDTFAEAQKLYYDAIKVVVRNHIEANWETLKGQWESIHTFFKKVHKASPQHHAWESEHVNMDEWLDNNEIGGYKNVHVPPRTKYHDSDPKERSIPHIARDINGPKVANEKDPTDDKEAMIDFFSDYLLQVTFNHSFIHRTQYIDSPDIPNVKDFYFSTIALQNKGEGEDFISTEDALQQAALGETFEDFPVKDYRFMDNQEILAEMRKAVETIAQRLKELGYPVKHLTYSIVI